MTIKGTTNGVKFKDDAWASLSVAKKAIAVGVSERTLASYKAAGCDLDRGAAFINRWRVENLHPRHGGLPSREPPVRGGSDGEIVAGPGDDQEVCWYLNQTKDSLTLLECRNKIATDDRL